MGTAPSVGGGRWLLSGPIVFLLLVGALLVVWFPDAAPYIGFFGLIAGLTTSSWLFYRRSAALPAGERRAWRLVAIGLALFGSGVIFVGLLTGAGISLPAFGLMDVFFLGAYVAMIAALFQLARLESGGREWVLTLLDALVGGIALGALVWNAFYGDLIRAMEGAPWWETTIAVIYPVVDMMVVTGLLILVMRRSQYHLDLRLVFFALGGLAQVLADFIYLNRSIGDTFTPAEPAWGINLVATAFMLCAATIVDRGARKREFPEEPTPIWAVVWPYVLAAVLFVVHFQNYRQLAPGSREILLLDALILIAIVILGRQLYVIYRDRDRVDRKRAELVASVSHELRTPLTAMVGFLTLLDDHSEEFPVDVRHEMVREAADQARHMSRLVSDLLVLARGDSSLLPIEREEVRAMSILLAVMRNTDMRQTNLEEDFDAEVLVYVDPDRIQQALVNLLNNAIRYGGSRCLVAARVVGRDLILEVHDDGEGVPTRFESVIWQHFERGAHRLDAATPGLGIGLSIVQAVMESHGGRVDYRVSGRLGGACFALTIPGCVLGPDRSGQTIPAGS